MWMKNRLDVHPTFFFYSEDIPIKIPSSLKSLKKLQKTEVFVHKIVSLSMKTWPKNYVHNGNIRFVSTSTLASKGYKWDGSWVQTTKLHKFSSVSTEFFFFITTSCITSCLFCNLYSVQMPTAYKKRLCIPSLKSLSPQKIQMRHFFSSIIFVFL